MRPAESGFTQGFGGRRGFTLIELLLVMAIIGVLMALAVGGVARFRDRQMQANTEMLVNKASKLLLTQWRAAIDDANQDSIPRDILNNWAGGDPQRARVIWIKLCLRREFPTSYAEALNPSPLPPRNSYVKALQGVATSSTPRPGESAACLLLALTAKNRRGAGVSADVFSANEMADTDSDGIMELVDGWRRPLAFFRWPYGNEELNPSGPASGFNDPEDPLGHLSNPSWWSSAPNGVALFQLNCYPVVQNSSYKLRPIIVSAGRDGRLGLDRNTMNGVYSSDGQDNIYSNRLRAR